MQLTNIQVAGLHAEAACATSEVAATLAGTERLAYLRGVQDGRTLLARELLQEAADRHGRLPVWNAGVPGMDCKDAERPMACTCDACVSWRNALVDV